MAELPVDDARSAIRDLAGDLTDAWLKTGSIPDDAVEAFTPELRDLLGGGLEISFDHFQHRHSVRPDWGFAQYSPPEFAAPFELYLPTSWRVVPSDEQGVATIVDERGARRQVLQVARKEQYEDAIDGAVYAGDLIGFEVGRDYGQFIHWRFVSETPQGYDIWSLFGAGDAALVLLGEAADADELKTQLTSSMNSIPWRHWIELAKRSDA